MNKPSFLFFFVFFSLIFLSACSTSPTYSKAYDFKDGVWKANEPLTFEIDITDTIKSYDILFFLRVNLDYDYNNAWINLHSTLPNNEKYKESHEFHISDEKGNWLGKKSGSLIECEMLFKNRKFPTVGKYTFTIEQATTNAQLSNVNGFGMKLMEVHQ